MTDVALLKICQADVDTIELNVAEQEERSTDAITGQVLKPDLVRAARRQEMEYFFAKRVYKKVPRRMAMERQGKPPITVMWLDTNKGDDASPNYRSRLVAREVRKAWESSIFAPTPPLEALRSILSIAATDLRGRPAHDRRPTSSRRTQV